MTAESPKVIVTSANTAAGLARAYVRQHGGQYRGEATRDHFIRYDDDGTISVYGRTGSRREPRGVVCLATGVVIDVRR